MEEIVSIEDLIKAYKDCRKHKRNKSSAVKFELNLEENLYTLKEELNNGTYTIGKSIAFVVTKPKYREVFAADFRDRIVHHLLIRKLEPYLENYFADSAYACRKGKGTLYGVKNIGDKIQEITNNYTENAWVLKLDIKGFFMSIDKDILMSGLEKFMRTNCTDWSNLEWWIELTKKIVFNRPELNCDLHGNIELWKFLEKCKSLFYTNGKGLPIGNLTSQFFAGFYLTPVDKFLESIPNILYGRYADDIIIISRCKELLLSLIPKLRRFLKEKLHLELHPDKVYLQPSKRGITAYGTILTGNGLILPGKRLLGNTYNALLTMDYKFRNNPEMGVNKFIRRMNSYYGFMIHLNGYKARVKLYKAIADSVFSAYVKNYHYKYIKLNTT